MGWRGGADGRGTPQAWRRKRRVVVMAWACAAIRRVSLVGWTCVCRGVGGFQHGREHHAADCSHLGYSVTNAPYNGSYPVLRVYARAGEMVQIGSSAMGLGGAGNIRVYPPGTISRARPTRRCEHR